MDASYLVPLGEIFLHRPHLFVKFHLLDFFCNVFHNCFLDNAEQSVNLSVNDKVVNLPRNDEVFQVG